MQIVIDIPEGMLDELHTCKFPIHEAYRLCKTIEDGKPLPKGHGRLIDADAFIKAECSRCDGSCDFCDCDCLSCKSEWRCDFIKDIDSADVIIGADKEAADERRQV